MYIDDFTFQAIIKGDVSEVREALLSNESQLNECFCLGWAPIHLAVAFGKIDIVKLLVDSYDAGQFIL